MTLAELGQCPQCQRWMLLPASAVAETIACPWCKRALPEAELQRIPALPATSADGGDTAPSQDRPERLAAAPNRLLGNLPPTDEVVASAKAVLRMTDRGGPAESLGGPAEEVAQRVHVHATVAGRGKKLADKRQPGRELAKIVAGGLAGLLIAQLMLWWLPGLGRRDPLQLARHVPAWLQFVLPSDLRDGP
jgi:hypothetical protein